MPAGAEELFGKLEPGAAASQAQRPIHRDHRLVAFQPLTHAGDHPPSGWHAQSGVRSVTEAAWALWAGMGRCGAAQLPRLVACRAAPEPIWSRRVR
jgi:hypothetical protein